MKTAVHYNASNDCLTVMRVASKSRLVAERSYGPGICRVVDTTTREQIGWTLYDFTALFTDGHLDPDGLPRSSEDFEIDAVPTKSFSFDDLLQWAYDHLVPQAVKAA